MAIEVQLSDLLGLYAKAGARILGRVSDRFINSFHQVFKIDEDLRHDYFRDKGISLARRHRYIQAQKLLIELHGEYPEDGEVALYLGICYFKTGKHELALPLLESALSDRPENQRLRTILAKIYGKVGDQQKLLNLLRENQEANPEDFDISLQLATALDRAGEMEEAVKVLERALEIDSASLKAHRMVAVLYETLGESEKATIHHKRVIELEDVALEIDDADAVTIIEESESTEEENSPADGLEEAVVNSAASEQKKGTTAEKGQVA